MSDIQCRESNSMLNTNVSKIHEATEMKLYDFVQINRFIGC